MYLTGIGVFRFTHFLFAFKRPSVLDPAQEARVHDPPVLGQLLSLPFLHDSFETWWQGLSVSVSCCHGYVGILNSGESAEAVLTMVLHSPVCRFPSCRIAFPSPSSL